MPLTLKAFIEARYVSLKVAAFHVGDVNEHVCLYYLRMLTKGMSS